MDPKSFAGKPPRMIVVDPEFGAKAAEWIKKDMARAAAEKKKRDEERRKKAGEGK